MYSNIEFIQEIIELYDDNSAINYDDYNNDDRKWLMQKILSSTT